MKNVRTSFIQYKKDCTTKQHDIKTYIELCNRYSKFLINKVMEGYEVSLPSKLGSLRIGGYQQTIRFDEEGNVRGLSPNWRKTKELWDNNPQAKAEKKIVYNTNEHTDGIRYKFIWSKKRVLVCNKTLYSLRMTRENKRRVYKSIMEGKEFL